jgi:L-aminopeptidase/D-esterase-like protein
MKSFKIGHYTDLENGTGCSVILCPDGVTASAYARGVSPGTREFALLSPFRKVNEIHGLLFTGGSAFGLDAASGIMTYLKEQHRGYVTPNGKIPIVPAAVIYDLNVLNAEAYPKTENSYQACLSAKTYPIAQGNVGAGSGATIGKWAGMKYKMKGGLGIAQIQFKNLVLMVVAVVNSVGDIIGKDGQILAGAQQNKLFLAEQDSKIRWKSWELGFGENTVLIAVLTNAKLHKLHHYYVAERAHNGIVRTIVPAHTQYDGDIVFSIGTNEVTANVDLVAEVAIDTVQQAIWNGVQSAKKLGEIISIHQLKQT